MRSALLESDFLLVELAEHATARPLAEIADEPVPTFLVHGFFKGVIVVEDPDAAVATLQARGVEGISPIREDDATASRFAFLKDPDGNFLQLLQRGADGAGGS
jgi:hypothetical protein